MSFQCNLNKGFRMTFENGFEISVQWGTMNYCQRKEFTEMGIEQKQDHWESSSAEIAVFSPDGGMLPITEIDTVAGWLTTDQVAKVITIVSSATSDNEVVKKVKSLNL